MTTKMSATTRLVLVLVVLAAGLVGWLFFGLIGAAVGLALGLLVTVVRWWRQPLWSWIGLLYKRRRPIRLTDPVTVANDRSGGGVRYQDGYAVAAVQLLGKAHVPTVFTGATDTATDNVLEVADLQPLLQQSLGLSIESLSVVVAGARRRSTGDYPQVYDSLIGPPPYAGQRETWLIVRVPTLSNAEALQWRSTAGTAALAAAQRVSSAMRWHGLRAKVATATDIVEMERRLGRSALVAHNQRWRSVRSDGGWLTTYWYRPQHVTSELMSQAWSMRVDGVIQNITLFADGRATATLTVRTAQPPPAAPSVLLRNLPGEQAAAVAGNLCGPLPRLRGLRAGPLPPSLVLPVGSSGVLLGKVGAGDRLMLPLGDPGEFSRVHITAEDALAKRIIIRAAGAGDRVTVHTRNPARWASVRMPHISVTDRTRPAAGTTVSVVDGTVQPAPRPNTVVSISDPGTPHRDSADVLITQVGPANVEVSAAGATHSVEVELFRAENRYISSEPIRTSGSPDDQRLQFAE